MEIEELLNRSNESTEFPEELEKVLDLIASSGFSELPWNLTKSVLKRKMILILDHFFQTYGFTGQITDSFEARKDEIVSLLDRYEDPPFTLQRFAEILQTCTRQFRRTHVLMNSLVKVLLVPSQFC